MFDNGPFTFEEKTTVYPGKGGWTFLPIPSSLGTELKKRHKFTQRRGWGSFPVESCIGETCWQTSIFPDKGNRYLLPVKKSIRTLTGMQDDFPVRFSIKILGGI